MAVLKQLFLWMRMLFWTYFCRSTYFTEFLRQSAYVSIGNVLIFFTPKKLLLNTDNKWLNRSIGIFKETLYLQGFKI